MDKSPELDRTVVWRDQTYWQNHPEEWVRRLKETNTNDVDGVWSALVNVYYHDLMRIACRFFKNAADVDDMMQETFTKAITHLEQLRDATSLRWWLARIVQNACVSLRRERERCSAVSSEQIEQIPDAVWDTPPDQLADEELFEQYRNWVEELDPREQEVLDLRANGLNFREIGEALGHPASTMRTWFRRMRKSFHDQLRRIGLFEDYPEPEKEDEM